MIFEGIQLNQLNDEEVLFFIRIRGKESYFKNVYTNAFLEKFEKLKQFRCISEYKKDSDVHIDLNKIERDYLFAEEYSDFNNLFKIEEIIARCRALRNISFIDAKKLIFRAYLFFIRFYEKEKKLKMVAIGAVDNYIMDMMVTIGKKYNISFIGVTDSFLSPEYKLCTIRGESNNIGICTEEEINNFVDKIKKSIENSKSPKLSRIIKNNLYYFSSFIYRYI
ncbi:hypothetical protein CRU99_13425, partial [Malaciobacter mytili]|uniref:hypothetical protein n=1 Tax=Malaciobacter mytili TaxID=603050 RepID=UPI001026B88B